MAIDLKRLARALDPGAWDRMKGLTPGLNSFDAATFENCIKRQRKAKRQARAAALDVLAQAIADAELSMDRACVNFIARLKSELEQP